MPLYDYRFTDEQGGDFTEVQSIHADALITKDGRPCEKTIQKPRVRTKYGEGSGTSPIEMLSIAVDNEDEIDEFRKRNPGVEISRDRRDRNFGVPIATSRSEKLRILKAEGFVETN